MFFEDSQDQSLLQSIALISEAQSPRSATRENFAHRYLSDLNANMKARRHERYPFFRKASWDFFTGGGRFKPGYIMNISKGGCLLKASEPIDHRRWVRLMIQDHQSNVCFSHVGRVVRRQDASGPG